MSSNEKLDDFTKFMQGTNQPRTDLTIPDDMFEPYYGLMVDAMSLIQERFTPKEIEFLRIAERVRKDEIAPAELQDWRDRVTQYRSAEYGIESYDEPISEHDAITWLFYCLFWGRKMTTFRTKANAIMALENFIQPYTEFFGHADLLIELYYFHLRSNKNDGQPNPITL